MSWKIGPMRSVKGDRVASSGPGFVLHDEDGKPCVAFVYLSNAAAAEGRKALQLAIDGAAELLRVSAGVPSEVAARAAGGR